MSIPRKIQQVWIGGKIPKEAAAMVAGVWAKHPEWECRLWDDHSLAELGVQVEQLRVEFGHWALVSNVIRLLILQRHGGFFLDVDFDCLRPLDQLVENRAVAAMQDGGRICNAFMGAEPNHPWINWQLQHLGDYEKMHGASAVQAATDAPRDGLTIIESHLVYPYLYDAQPEARVPHRDSILEHHWDGSWSK